MPDLQSEKVLTQLEQNNMKEFDNQIRSIKNLFNNKDFLENVAKKLCPTTLNDLKRSDILLSTKLSPSVKGILNMKKETLMPSIKTTITTIQDEITSLDLKIYASEQKLLKNGTFDVSDVFNNDEQNINIQNKLIFSLRYKYNLFLSILFVIGMIVIYHYLIPTLNLPITNPTDLSI